MDDDIKERETALAIDQQALQALDKENTGINAIVGGSNVPPELAAKRDAVLAAYEAYKVAEAAADGDGGDMEIDTLPVTLEWSDEATAELLELDQSATITPEIKKQLVDKAKASNSFAKKAALKATKKRG